MKEGTDFFCTASGCRSRSNKYDIRNKLLRVRVVWQWSRLSKVSPLLEIFKQRIDGHLMDLLDNRHGGWTRMILWFPFQLYDSRVRSRAQLWSGYGCKAANSTRLLPATVKFGAELHSKARRALARWKVHLCPECRIAAGSEAVSDQGD